MKKFIKPIAILLIIATLSLFAGCKSLDEKKANQAFWNNKQKTEIVLDGKTFKQLPHCEYFSPADMLFKKGSYVTDKDVPVLLASQFERYSISPDRKILLCLGGIYYARSDVFETYENYINNYSLDNLATYNYLSYSGNNLLKFSEEETKLIKEAIENASETAPLKDYCDYILEILRVDKDLLFQKNEGELMYTSSTKSLIFLNEDKYFSIPEEYHEQLIEMLKKYTSKVDTDYLYD